MNVMFHWISFPNHFIHMKSLLGYDKNNLWNTNTLPQLDELQPTKLEIQHQHHRLGISKIYQSLIQRCFVPRLQFLRLTAYRNPISISWKAAVGCWHWQGNSLGKNWYQIHDPKTDQNRTSGMDQHFLSCNKSGIQNYAWTSMNHIYNLKLRETHSCAPIGRPKKTSPVDFTNSSESKFMSGPQNLLHLQEWKEYVILLSPLFQGYLTHTIHGTNSIFPYIWLILMVNV